MHKPSVSNIVYKTLFPRPRPTDPTSFAAHIARNLVPEVRIETASFYGALDCIEAQYPGLDYSHSPHRRRLSRFPWHKKLFKAFDELGLTRTEIWALCQWEGTKSAKDKYEKDAGRPIIDTTMEGIGTAEPPGRPVAYFNEERDWRAEARRTTAEQGLVEDGGTDSEEDDSDQGEDETVTNPDVVRLRGGLQLNQRLQAAIDARARGEMAVYDEQWEQLMKELMERNGLGADGLMDAVREGRPFLVSPSSALDATTDHASVMSTSPPADDSSDGTPRRSSQRLADTQLTRMNLYSLESQVVSSSPVAATATPNLPAAEAR